MHRRGIGALEMDLARKRHGQRQLARWRTQSGRCSSRGNAIVGRGARPL
jgi:hypothetical protein